MVLSTCLKWLIVQGLSGAECLGTTAKRVKCKMFLHVSKKSKCFLSYLKDFSEIEKHGEISFS